MHKILTSILVFSLVACGQTKTPEKETSDNSSQQVKKVKGWELLDLPDYSISFPGSWELNQSGQMGTSFVLFSPVESTDDTFKENVNLLIQDISGQNVNLDEYTRISEDQVKKLLSGSELLVSKRMKNENGDYQKLIYTGDQGAFHLKFEQYYWIIDGKVIVLTLTGEESKFADYQKTGEKMMNSFVWKK